MKKVSIWVTLGAVVAAFAGGFSFANYLNRGQMTGVQNVPAGSGPAVGQPSQEQDATTRRRFTASQRREDRPTGDREVASEVRPRESQDAAVVPCIGDEEDQGRRTVVASFQRLAAAHRLDVAQP